MSADAVFIACPTHDGRLADGTAQALYAQATRRQNLVCVHTNSLLSFNCNTLLFNALNHRESHGLKWFAMLHSDVMPDALWVDTLIAQAEQHDADFVSAVVAIKDGRGLTSTAVGGVDDWDAPRRLTVNEVAVLPKTFGLDDGELLCNTGCCVFRLDRPWLDPNRVRFHSPNRLTLVNGAWTAQTIPEDWFFTRAIARAGAMVMATTAVKTNHRGVADYPSDRVWGFETDQYQQPIGASA
jgi:hypothetical protein